MITIILESIWLMSNIQKNVQFKKKKLKIGRSNIINLLYSICYIF